MNDSIKTTDPLRADYNARRADLEAARLALVNANASQTARGAIALASLRVAVGEAEDRFYSSERALADALDADAGIDDATFAAHLEAGRVAIAGLLADVAALEAAQNELVATEAARRAEVNAARRAAGDPRVRRPIDPTVLGGWRECEAALRSPLPRRAAPDLEVARAALRAAQLVLIREEREAAQLAAQLAERDRGAAWSAEQRAADELEAAARARIAAAAQRAEDDAAIAALEAR